MPRKTRRLFLVLLALGLTGGVVVAGRALAGGGRAPAAAEQSTPSAEHTTEPAADPMPSAAVPSTPTSRTPSSGATPTATPTATSAAGGTPVDVVLGYADWDQAGHQVEAAGFAGVVESGGSCVLVLTSGSQRVEASAAAEPDASTTNCGRLTVPGDRLTPGQWTVALSYRSARSAGTSQTMTVTVPAR